MAKTISSYGIPVPQHDGGAVQKNKLRTYFQKGSLIRTQEMEALITSSLNAEETGSQNVKSVLCFTSGSGTAVSYSGTDPWNEICPPFVPYFHPYIDVFTLDNHTILHSSSFASSSGEGTIFQFDNDGAEASFSPISNDTDFPFGAFTLKTDNNTNDETAIGTNFTLGPFNMLSGSMWWIKTRFKFDDHDNVEYAFGLTETNIDQSDLHNISAAAGKDRIIICKSIHNNDETRFIVTKNSDVFLNRVISSSAYTVDNQIHDLGLHFDGQNIHLYATQSATGNTPRPMEKVHTFTTGSSALGGLVGTIGGLNLVFYLRTGANTVETATIEYIQGAVWNRTRDGGL